MLVDEAIDGTVKGWYENGLLRYKKFADGT